MIPVTKPYLPDRNKLDKYIDGIYQREWLTNNGPLVQELTHRLEGYLGVKNLLLVGNGTLALQVAYRALGISGVCDREITEAITTPFSFVATTSSLKWEGIEPRFVDIDRKSWCLDPLAIEQAITDRTKGIVPVHVFGNACDVDSIDEIANKHNLPVIYDAAHAFGVIYQGKSLLTYGDAATLSFHATMLFHSIEGGGVIFRRKEDFDKAKEIINFGISSSGNIERTGINAKMSEFQAAMGLSVLDDIDLILEKRREIWEAYHFVLRDCYVTQVPSLGEVQNYSYFPVVLNSEKEVEIVVKRLHEKGVMARRYFFPPLNSLPYVDDTSNVSNAADISRRIICLPVYHGLSKDMVADIAKIVRRDMV